MKLDRSSKQVCLVWLLVAPAAGYLRACTNAEKVPSNVGLESSEAGGSGKADDSGEAADTGVSEGSVAGPRAEVQCAGLPEGECTAHIPQGCEPLYGWTSDLAESRYAGCRTSGYGGGYRLCATALSCGVNPATGECWGFGGTCAPDGWTSLANSDCPRPADCPATCQCNP